MAVCAGCGMRTTPSTALPKVALPERLSIDSPSCDRALLADLRREKGILVGNRGGWAVTPVTVRADGDPDAFKMLDVRSEARRAEWMARWDDLKSSPLLKFVREEQEEEIAPADLARFLLVRERTQAVQQKYAERLLNAQIRVANLRSRIAAAADGGQDSTLQSAELERAEAQVREIESAEAREIAEQPSPVQEAKTSVEPGGQAEAKSSPVAETEEPSALTLTGWPSAFKHRRPTMGRSRRVIESAEYKARLDDMSESIDAAIRKLSCGKAMRKVK